MFLVKIWVFFKKIEMTVPNFVVNRYNLMQLFLTLIIQNYNQSLGIKVICHQLIVPIVAGIVNSFLIFWNILSQLFDGSLIFLDNLLRFLVSWFITPIELLLLIICILKILRFSFILFPHFSLFSLISSNDVLI